jgi:hypothetical protein
MRRSESFSKIRQLAWWLLENNSPPDTEKFPVGLNRFGCTFEAQVERTSTDSNFAIHKEKEMNFRRLLTAMALLALCVGLASAQISGGGGTLSCQASVSGTPALRTESNTELVADIVLTCTGGTLQTTGAIPTTDITVNLGATVTSRLLDSTTGATEAVLLVDEPGSGLAGPVAGFGPNAGQVLCASANGAVVGGCQEFAVAVDATATANAAGPYVVASGSSSSVTVGANVFKGIASGTQVTFRGVPVLPPVTSGIARVFRIKNVRVNASSLSAGTPLTAFITAGSVPISNAVQTVGVAQTSLSTSLQTTNLTGSFSPASLAQCSSQTRTAVATLRFSELFSTAFKTRGASTQTNPLTNYNTESGLVVGSYTMTSVGTTVTAGLADTGTRLKAVFNNLPAGVRIYVSTEDVSGGAGNVSNGTPKARLVVNETTPDTPSVPTVSPTTTAGTNVNVVELPVVNGSATAVWEVVIGDPSVADNYDFGVYITYTANTGSNSPAPGTGTVNMSYAPTTAATSSNIPRFADTSSAKNLFSVVICQTVLLYPFVTNAAGFDTGIAIANTSADPFGSAPQAGTCSLSFYGSSAPSAAVTTPNIASGTVFTTLASTAAAGFQGYMIAVCNFQLAHGFAFISDVGAKNLAMGYLATVVSTGTAKRSGTEALNN